ncbi:MAG: RsmD family RNA methyltransferase [Candidatus Nomurabacteria bacterium]|nr:RsmD family RNA methyltransferase [Candidatus Nomurabacteria bacterium]
MRVIAGKFKGLRLEAPSADAAHVMGERERGAIFNALFSLGGFEGARVLDVFAGSGALGLEAVSRGAASVEFVENNPKTREIIKNNISAILPTPARSTTSLGHEGASAPLGAATASPIHPAVPSGSVEPRGLDINPRSTLGESNSRGAEQQYEIIFSDAPYDKPQWGLVAELPGRLASGGKLVISHAKTTPIPDELVADFASLGLEKVYEKTFAAAEIEIFRKK